MRILLKWIKDYVDIDESVNDLAERLTMAGFEVEEVKNFKDDFKHLKTARILNVLPHPKADKLKICEVSIGNTVLNVVCGAPNVTVNSNVIIALPGADLKGVKIEKSVIRGVESNGMLCSEKELGLALHSEGIAILPEDTKVGLDLWQHYEEIDDYILDLSITPNRGDCLSHLGIAREIAAITGKKLKNYLPSVELVNKGDFAYINIYAPELCHRYTGKLIKNVTIKDSPHWLKFRLLACGMRPINNIVDITNYIMLDLGQPLHAFDYDLIQEKTIIVRKAFEREKLTTLDGKERLLTTEDLVIADKEKAIALAGVMGGLETEVTEKTRNIFLESAFFNPATIRKTAKRLLLQSEASYRFERCVDIYGVPFAAEKAALMMTKYADGEASSYIIDANPVPFKNKILKFRLERCARYLGSDEPLKEAEKRLSLLNFNVEKKASEWVVTVPSYRSDITLEEDLYEEIARLGFYKEIKAIMPNVAMKARKDNKERNFYTTLRNFLVDYGATEVITYSFIPESELKKIQWNEKWNDTLVFIKNPLTEENVVMRPNMLASHLNVCLLNHSRLNFNIKFFEIGKKYLLHKTTDGIEYKEEEILSLVFSGLRFDKTWYSKEEPVDFFYLKGFIEQLCQRLIKTGCAVNAINADNFPFLHPKESGELWLEGKRVGFLGLIHPDVALEYDLKKDIYVAEIDLKVLYQLFTQKMARYYGLSKFPWVDRDITVIAKENICHEEIIKIILDNASDILKDVKLVDIYRGDKIGKDKKSMTYKLYYQSSQRTLSDEEVNYLNEKIAKILAQKLEIEFPQ